MWEKKDEEEDELDTMFEKDEEYQKEKARLQELFMTPVFGSTFTDIIIYASDKEVPKVSVGSSDMINRTVANTAKVINKLSSKYDDYRILPAVDVRWFVDSNGTPLTTSDLKGYTSGIPQAQFSSAQTGRGKGGIPPLKHIFVDVDTKSMGLVIHLWHILPLKRNRKCVIVIARFILVCLLGFRCRCLLRYIRGPSRFTNISP
jgi:hypothetical protein